MYVYLSVLDFLRRGGYYKNKGKATSGRGITKEDRKQIYSPVERRIPPHDQQQQQQRFLIISLCLSVLDSPEGEVPLRIEKSLQMIGCR